ncbi:hypothetical protein B0H13DRAFT_1855856 [Mycena leptocephala]|nr:hypothetical protein B0H13DRAFT_1855856 [Mycena leptocephala]
MGAGHDESPAVLRSSQVGSRRVQLSRGIFSLPSSLQPEPRKYSERLAAVDEERQGGRWLESGCEYIYECENVTVQLLILTHEEQSEVVRARVVFFLMAPAGGIASASLTTLLLLHRRVAWTNRRLLGAQSRACGKCTFARAAIYGMECRDARLRAMGAAAEPVTVPASPQGSRSAEVCGASRRRRGRRHIWRRVDTAVEGEVAEFSESRRAGGSIRDDSPYGDKSQGVWVLLTCPKVEPEDTLMQPLR